jgi:hypothetical protein
MTGWTASVKGWRCQTSWKHSSMQMAYHTNVTQEISIIKLRFLFPSFSRSKRIRTLHRIFSLGLVGRTKNKGRWKGRGPILAGRDWVRQRAFGSAHSRLEKETDISHFGNIGSRWNPLHRAHHPAFRRRSVCNTGLSCQAPSSHM